MEINEIIKDICADEGVSVTELGRKVGKTSQFMFNTLKRTNMTVDTVCNMLDSLGYSLYVVDNNTVVNGYKVKGDCKPMKDVRGEVEILKAELLELLKKVESMEDK